MSQIAERVDRLEWSNISDQLHASGWSPLPPLIQPHEAEALVSLYDDDVAFRSTVTMARHGFGRGEYRYFRYPLPQLIVDLRTRLYPRLVPVANAWRAHADLPPLPNEHDDYISLCRAGGQTKPTPLMLRYGPGDYNCLHQDLYGELVFPLQVVLLLSERKAFDGGELVLTEQRPRMQSRPSVVQLEPRGGAVFAVARRPVEGRRGTYHVNMRHGVSTVIKGQRNTLGIIFHDAA